MKTTKRLLALFCVFFGVFVALELSKYLRKKGRLQLNNDDVDILEKLDAIEVEANNLPDIILNKEYLRWKPNNKCAKFPRIQDIETSNTYWQVLTLASKQEEVPNMYLPLNEDAASKRENVYIFGAYFDSRGPDVKVLAMARGNPAGLHCNVWFDKGVEPKVVQSDYHYVWSKDWKFKPHLLNPYVFTCVLQDNWQGHFPKAVSLIGERCEKATNLLKVNHPVKVTPEEDQTSSFDEEDAYGDYGTFGHFDRRTKDFMVCVKGLDFPDDISYKLIEWIELIRLLGADKIHFYILHVHENVAKVLEHYKQVGWVLTEGLTIPESYASHSARKRTNRPQEKRYELIPYNDCFYKHREEYKYVILLDVDEIIMPNIGNWKDLIAKVQHANPDDIASTFSVPNAYFFDDALQNADVQGQHLHMLRTLHRTRNITQPSMFVKGFHNASDVVTLHNHFPIECVNGECNEVKIHEDVAKLAHYRSCPELLRQRCSALRKDSVKDDAILRFKEQLVENVMRTVKNIDL